MKPKAVEEPSLFCTLFGGDIGSPKYLRALEQARNFLEQTESPEKLIVMWARALGIAESTFEANFEVWN